MDKYKKLIYNTLIFGIGTFSSKLLVFFLLPLYTRVLTKSDYGLVDLIIQSSNLLIPIVSVGITNAVIRFGLDRSVNKSSVFTTGLATILCGFSIFLLLEPLVSKIQFISEYLILIYAFVLMSSLRSLCSQFIRAKNMVRLYAFDGIISSITTTSLTIIFLVVLRFGIYGYVAAIILSDFLSSAFLFLSARLYRYINFNIKDKSIPASMIKYSVPLIPTTIFWWITNVSDRFIVAHMLGTVANGLYAIAYKIPTIVTLVSSIFIEAWQLSAVSEKNTTEQERFFTNVFKSYSSLVFIAASTLILLLKIITRILVSESFYESWRYVPFLVMATSFSCLVNFLGSIYFVEKKSNITLVTTFIGAVLNVFLNFMLIPKFGVNGASFATFVSFAAVFVIRALNSRKYIKINYNPRRLETNTIFLLLQSFIMIFEVPLWPMYEALIWFLIILINSGEILMSSKKLLRSILRK